LLVIKAALEEGDFVFFFDLLCKPLLG